jgi:iron(III) transport system permease protein
MSHRFFQVLTAILLGVFALLLIWPVATVITAGFSTRSGDFTFAYTELLLEDPVVWRGLANALWIALGTTALCLVISLPLAVLSTRYDFPGRGLVSSLTLMPLILPPFVGALGMRLVLARFGPITQLVAPASTVGVDWLGSLRVGGVIVVEALGLYPILLLSLQSALANVDPTLERAAQNLGATRWTTFWRVTLPLVRPGLFAGATLVFIWSFTELGTPLMFQVYEVTPVQVFNQLSELDNPLPHALVVVMLVASGLLYLVGKVFLGKSAAMPATKVLRAGGGKRIAGLRGALALVPFAVVLALSLLPHVAVVLTSLSTTGAWYRSLIPREFTGHHYIEALQDELVMPSFDGGQFTPGAIGNSILYATLATLLGMALALATAVVVVRSQVRVRWLLDVLATLPLAVPGLVLAFGYLSIGVTLKRLMGEATPAFLDVQRSPVLFLVLAYATRRLPYIVRSAVAGLEQTPPVLELSARNLGASLAVSLRRITLPLIMANLLAGGLMAFTFALLEVSDSLVLAQTAEYFPITKAIWELSQRLGDGAHIASALGVWAMVLLGLTLLAVSATLGKRLGALFR